MGYRTLPIYDAKRSERTVLESKDYDAVYRCCVTLDQIDDIASRAEDLSKLGIDIGPNPVWTVSINDLLVIADLIANPLVFIDYLRERLRAFASPTCHVSDELDHLGLYLEHNRYVMRAEKYAPVEADGWFGYRDAFDKYYASQWQGEGGQAPKQEMPRVLEQMLDLLAQSRSQGRVKVAEMLLSMDGDARDAFAAQVEYSRELQKRQHRPRPLSFNGDVPLTVLLSQKGALFTSIEDARQHAITVMAIENEKHRLVVHLHYAEHDLLESVKWAELSDNDVSQVDSDELSSRVENLRKRRANLGSKDKIERIR